MVEYLNWLHTITFDEVIAIYNKTIVQQNWKSPFYDIKTHSNTLNINYKLMPQIYSFLILKSQQYNGAKNKPIYLFIKIWDRISNLSQIFLPY